MRRANDRHNQVTGDPAEWICRDCGGHFRRLLPAAGGAVAMFHPHILDTGKGMFWASIAVGLVVGAAFWTALGLLFLTGNGP